MDENNGQALAIGKIAKLSDAPEWLLSMEGLDDEDQARVIEGANRLNRKLKTITDIDTDSPLEVLLGIESTAGFLFVRNRTTPGFSILRSVDVKANVLDILWDYTN